MKFEDFMGYEKPITHEKGMKYYNEIVVKLCEVKAMKNA